jgi:acetyl-CoA carboxylase carboxyl transferase subunit beta
VNWISNFVRPKIQAVLRKRETPENLWNKCGNCGEMIFHRELIAAQHVCLACGFHMKIEPKERLASLFDNGSYTLLDIPEVASDPLRFRDSKRYAERLKAARTATQQDDAMLLAEGRLDEIPVVILVQNFSFMGGSMGMAVGESMLRAAEIALEQRAPLIVFTAAGGARMQEGILSLMQMPRTTIAVQMIREAGLPYIVVLTDPTTGGVTASYAMLGDVNIAEPGALIGFAGPRVIEQTIREQLPPGFQRAEYLLEHGMVDMVVHRHDLRATLARIIRLLTKRGPRRDNTDPGGRRALPPPSSGADGSSPTAGPDS